MKQLEAARQLKQWTQPQAAEACGLNRGTYYRIEEGKLGVSPDLAKRIAKTFGLPVDSLFVPSRYTSNEFEAKVEEPAEAKAS